MVRTFALYARCSGINHHEGFKKCCDDTVLREKCKAMNLVTKARLTVTETGCPDFTTPDEA